MGRRYCTALGCSDILLPLQKLGHCHGGRYSRCRSIRNESGTSGFVQPVHRRCLGSKAGQTMVAQTRPRATVEIHWCFASRRVSCPAWWPTQLCSALCWGPGIGSDQLPHRCRDAILPPAQSFRATRASHVPSRYLCHVLERIGWWRLLGFPTRFEGWTSCAGLCIRPIVLVISPVADMSTMWR